MRCSIDMERKGCESTECWTYVVTFNFELIHAPDLAFSSSNFEMLYPRNGRADWHGTKGIWVDRVLYLLCDLELWPWAWIFKVKVWKCCISGMGVPIDMELKGCESIGCWTHIVTLNFDLTHGLCIFKVNVSDSWFSGTRGHINMERKGYDSIRYYIYYVTLSYDFDLGFWRSNF